MKAESAAVSRRCRSKGQSDEEGKKKRKKLVERKFTLAVAVGD